MKVLFATYPMAFHTPGGGEIQLLAYQKNLMAQGVEVTLFDPWNPQFLQHDIFHFFSCAGGSTPVCEFAKKLGIPVVVSSSLWITEETRSQYGIAEITHQLHLADRIVANSILECDTLSRVLGLSREKFVPVYNGVDDLFFEKISGDIFREKYQLRSPFVLAVGNIEPRKNQLRLVQAMKSFPDMKLVLIGYERDQEYAKKCSDEAAGQVFFAGALANTSELLRSAYAACDVFCLPSMLETPGLSALEAFASECRIAITQVGSTKEYFGDQVCYLDPESVESLVSALQTARTRAVLPAVELTHPLPWGALMAPLKSTYESLLNEK
jgi:glycosyltransferase involved in cell wall biosynthesis